jgi:hypothetical protein
MLDILVIFVSGMLTGSVLTAIVLTELRYRDSLKIIKKAQETAAKLKRVKEIIEQQLNLKAFIETPQRNALDGKYKNGLIQELKVLEEEKKAIFKSVLDSGADPTITIIKSDGSKTQLKLSEFVADHYGTEPTPDTATQPTITPDGGKKYGKLTLYSNDDDNGSTH